MTGTLFLSSLFLLFIHSLSLKNFKDINKALVFFQCTHFNCVAGEIPQSLFNISSLRFLNLEINNLEDDEISSFSHCRELRVLKLSINQFIGGIPQALGSLSNLEELYLGYNKLTGGIPREIGNLSNLNILHLASSGINGPIPAEISISLHCTGLISLIIAFREVFQWIFVNIFKIQPFKQIHIQNSPLSC